MRYVMTIVTALMLAGSVMAVDFGVTGLSGSAADAEPSRASWEQANQAALAAAAEGGTMASGMADTTGYTLGAGDKVKVTVYNEESLSGEFEIDGTGVLAFPLAGDVRAGGLTARQLEKAITTKLSDGYLVNPRVSVEVLNFRPFFIYGEVNKPGAYPYVNGLTVINAVALAGGYTPRAKTGKVALRRNGGGTGEQMVDETGSVFPGDVIQVKERFF